MVIDTATEESSVTGVYVAGDMSRDVLLVAAAIAEGAQAAIAIDRRFCVATGFADSEPLAFRFFSASEPNATLRSR